jgi:hypothetical protein
VKATRTRPKIVVRGVQDVVSHADEAPASLRDFHIEDSLLSGLGRHVRPSAQIDPYCRVTPQRPTDRPEAQGAALVHRRPGAPVN